VASLLESHSLIASLLYLPNDWLTNWLTDWLAAGWLAE